MDRVALKEKAKEMIRGNKWLLWKPMLIICVMTFVVTFITGLIPGKIGVIIAAIGSIFISIFAMGYVKYLIKFVRGENPEFSDIVECVKERWLTIFLTSLLVGIFVGLWSGLCVSPGIIASMSYAMAQFLAVDSDMNPLECIRKSKEMMNGHKMEFFILGLSFIGWNILASFTLGLLYIWLMPYMNVPVTLFYENLNGRVQNVNAEVANPIQ